MTRLILLSITLLVLAGCSTTPAATPVALLPTSTAAPATATLPPPTPTTPPPTSTRLPPTIPVATSTLAPTPTATFAPETPVSGREDVVGTWLAPGGDYSVVLVEFQPTGAYRIKLPGQSDPVDQGRYRVEGSQLDFLTSSYCSTHQEASYEVYVTKQEGKSVRLRFVLVGDDLCAEHKDAFAERTLRLYGQ